MKVRIHLGILCFLSLSLFILFSSVSFADTDVTSKVQLNKSALIYDRRALTSSLNVSLTNISPDVLLTPIKVVIDNISDATVTVSNPDGTTPEGNSYFSYLITNGQLLSGQTIPAKKWIFNNPKSARFAYSVRVIGGIDQVKNLTETITSFANTLITNDESAAELLFLPSTKEANMAAWRSLDSSFRVSLGQALADGFQLPSTVTETNKKISVRVRITDLDGVLHNGFVVLTQDEQGNWKISKW